MTAVAVGVAVLLAVLLGWPGDPARLQRLLWDAASSRTTSGLPANPRRAWGGWSTTGRGTVAEETPPALVLDLVAAALAAGSPPEAALKAVGESVGGELGTHLVRAADRLLLGSDWQQAWVGCPSRLEPLRRSLTLAQASGAPAAGLLLEAARDERRRQQRGAQAEAARLAVRLVLPLGLCALPGFACWAVVPVVLSLAEGLTG